MYKHILIPTDGSALSDKAALSGVALARALGARVTALHVIPEPDSFELEVLPDADDEAQQRAERLREALAEAYLGVVRKAARKARVPCECVMMRAAQPHAEIILLAREKGCDLIVMASHGRKGETALLLGSETLKVMTLGGIPVLVHRVERPAS